MVISKEFYLERSLEFFGLRWYGQNFPVWDNMASIFRSVTIWPVFTRKVSTCLPAANCAILSEKKNYDKTVKDKIHLGNLICNVRLPKSIFCCCTVRKGFVELLPAGSVQASENISLLSMFQVLQTKVSAPPPPAHHQDTIHCTWPHPCDAT